MKNVCFLIASLFVFMAVLWPQEPQPRKGNKDIVAALCGVTFSCLSISLSISEAARKEGKK